MSEWTSTTRSPGALGIHSPAMVRTGADLRALDPKRLGLWVFLGTVTMLFAAFSSAYLVRMASGAWNAIQLPSILWLTTATIVVSSATLETARMRVGSTATGLLAMTLGLGLLFLGGQVAAWRTLAAAGVFVPDSPHAAFLYIFTALHGAHLGGGLIWLAVVWRTARGCDRAVGPVAGRFEAGPRRAARKLVDRVTVAAAFGLEDRLTRCATYWHFMTGVWIYLFAVLHLR